MEKTIRVTKIMRYNDIKCLLNGDEVKYGTTIDDAMDFLNHEIELSLKKSNKASGESKKPTKTQVENEGYKELILKYLGTVDKASVTDIQKGVPEFCDFANQKISALVRQLMGADKVRREEIKGKAYFALV